MKEEEFTEALHDVMLRSSPPPSMDPAQALDRARRARKRRTAVWAGTAVAAIVVGLGAGPGVVANYSGNRPVEPMVAGGPDATPSAATPSTGTTASPQAGTTITPTKPVTRKSDDPWPEGQTDRTATTGPRADRAVALMQALSKAVPDGFTTPDLEYSDGRAMRWPQAQYASNDGEPDYWEYMATIPVVKNNGVGQLLVQSTTPSGKPAAALCVLAKQFWGGTGPCSVVDVGGKKVGVLTTKGSGDRYDQWAAYRHDDGTVVFVAQTKKSDNKSRAALKQPIFTSAQLAELATSPKFKISE
jgi:hypothetical protein